MAAALTWSTACPDWRERIVARESLVPPPLFPQEAAKAVELFKSLKIVDAAFVRDPDTGEMRPPTFGEACEEWVFDFVAAIFGAYDAEEGRQLITEFFLLISKKNSKSTIAAGIMVTALVLNWRMSAELLLLAPTKDAADNCFNPARDMIRYNDTLRAMLDVREYVREIEHRLTKSLLRVVAADSQVVAGTKASFVLVDELWEFGKRPGPKTDAMLREATGGLASRPEGFVIYLSTHSDEPPAGVFEAKLHYFRAVRDGEIVDPASLGMLFEWPEPMLEAEDYLKPEWFYVTNPNLGRSVSLEFLTKELGKVAEARGGEKQVFLAKHLNVEIGMRLHAKRWRGADYWAAATDKAVTWETLKTRCEVVVFGVDGGGLDDLFALTGMGRETGTDDWVSVTKAWAQTDVFERRKDIVSVLEGFVADGDLVVCRDGPMQDILEAADIVEEFAGLGLLPEKGAVGLDPAGIAQLIDEFERRGLTAEQLVAIPQGYRLSGTIWACERLLKDRKWRPARQRLTEWSTGNCKAEQRGNAVLITKEAAGKAKIDPTMSQFNAASLLSRNPSVLRSPYEERGLLFL